MGKLVADLIASIIKEVWEACSGDQEAQKRVQDFLPEGELKSRAAIKFAKANAEKRFQDIEDSRES